MTGHKKLLRVTDSTRSTQMSTNMTLQLVLLNQKLKLFGTVIPLKLISQQETYKDSLHNTVRILLVLPLTIPVSNSISITDLNTLSKEDTTILKCTLSTDQLQLRVYHKMASSLLPWVLCSLLTITPEKWKDGKQKF